MNCMRCGKEIPIEEVFCEECLTDMERHPVKPGTPIQLPNRDAKPAAKRTAHRRNSTKPEEQLFKLRFAIFWLILVIVLLALALLICLGLLLNIFPTWISEMLLSETEQTINFINNLP